MKTLILLLVAGLTSPAFAQSSDNYETTTTSGSSSSYGTPSGTSTDMNEAAPVREDSSALYPSGSATEAPASNMAAPSASATVIAPAAPEATSTAYHETSERRMIPGGFYIEPGLFGSRETTDVNVGADNTIDADGFGADLKVGGHINEMFFLAVDGRYERSKFNEKSLDNVNSDTWNIGPTVGVQAPWFGARAWGTYVLDGSNNPESAANGLDLRFQKPYGWRGGVGVRFAAVSLNLEYEDLTYRETVVQSTGSLRAGAGGNINFGTRGYALSLSFPFQL